VQHHVGATPQSTSRAALVRRVLAELARHLGPGLDVPEEPALLPQALARGLALAAARGKVILALDGLDQLDDREASLGLRWLPEEVPAGVRLVVSTGPGAALEQLSRRRWPMLEVKPLSRAERARLVSSYLGEYGKRLGPADVAVLAAAGPAANPLYLRVLLEELRVFGRHEEVSAHLRHYLAAPGPEELYARVLARWEADYCRERPGLVRDTATLLWAARQGLAEAELLELLGAPGRPLPSADWAPLHHAARALLVDRSGLLTFPHPAARAAAEKAYLEDEKAVRGARRRLVDYFATRPWSPRKMEELPWQLAELGAWGELAAVLADREFLARAWASRPAEVRVLWARVEAASPQRLVDAYRPILRRPEDCLPAAWPLAAVLSETGHLAEATSLGARLLDQARATGDLSRLQAGLGLQAITLTRRGGLRAALRLLAEQDGICRRRDDRPALAANLGNQGALLRDLGERGPALAKQRAAEEMCRGLGEWAGVAAALGNQGVLQLDDGNTGAARDLFRQQEEICRARGDLAGLQASLGNQAAILRARGDLRGALALHREEEDFCRRLYDRPGLQTCLGNQARILQDQGDYDRALDRVRERKRICGEDGYQEGLAVALFQEAYLFGVKLGQAEFARPLAEDALRALPADADGALRAEMQALVDHLREGAREGRER
jgi:hypothetical protein